MAIEWCFLLLLYFIFESLFIYFERARAGEGQRERDRQKEPQAGSALSAHCPT